MEEMLFVGWQYGQFETDAGKMQPYCNAFFVADFAGAENQNYHFGGQKAIKKKCVKSEIFQNVKPGTRVAVMFDSYGRVSRLEPAQQPQK